MAHLPWIFGNFELRRGRSDRCEAPDSEYAESLGRVSGKSTLKAIDNFGKRVIPLFVHVFLSWIDNLAKTDLRTRLFVPKLQDSAIGSIL